MKSVVDNYAKLASEYETIMKSSYMVAKEPIDAFFETLQPGETFLDAGCGPGIEAEQAARRGAQITGLDFTPEMIARFRERLPNSTAVLGSLTQLPFGNGSFDVVFSSCAILHLNREDGTKAIREFHRVLKPGGRAYLATTTANNEEDLHNRPTFEAIDVKDLYFYHWKLEDLAQLLNEVGFIVLDTEARGVIPGRPAYTKFVFSEALIGPPPLEAPIFQTLMLKLGTKPSRVPAQLQYRPVSQ